MYEENIKKAGYKLTKPRKLILRFLQNEQHPLSAKEIHKQLKEQTDLVSVYRTLKLFEELLFLHKEERDGILHYYLASEAHHHIICESCGYTECVPCHHSFPKINGFASIKKHQFTLFGVCTQCTK